jgi:V8-like Glu-specific endopeptidase
VCPQPKYREHGATGVVSVDLEEQAMVKDKSTSGKMSAKPLEAMGQEDRPGDPLFVPHLELLDVMDVSSRELSGAARDEYAAILETICGAIDDSQPVEQYNGALGVTRAFVDAHQTAVGQLQWNDNLAAIYTNPGTVSGARWCTGTLISNDLFISAGHCFDQTGGGWERPRVNGTMNIISSQEIATRMHVNFNFQVDPAGNPRPEQSFPILQLVEVRLGGLDFAITRLGGNPGASFGVTRVSTTDAAIGDMICIIGHPAGQRKRIEAGPTTDVSGTTISYNDIDTMGGNSGSGILRASDGRIVGIHTNGGCNAQGTGSNSGVRIASIIAQSPVLQSLTRPKLKAIDDPITTINVLDNGGSMKFIDDPVRTNPIFDNIGTLRTLDTTTSKFLDDGVGTRKNLDDAKNPGLDNPGPFDPGRFGGGGRPFVMATPHHSTAWGGQGEAMAAEDQARGQYEAAIGQMEAHMAQLEQELRAFDQQYRQMVSEYQAAFGAGPP